MIDITKTIIQNDITLLRQKHEENSIMQQVLKEKNTRIQNRIKDLKERLKKQNKR